MASEVRFIKIIEKYETLYNNTLPEYNRKDLTEEAWAKVSRSTNLTVTECKEKWRNIRSSLLRSQKPGAKPKKPYYLAPHLQFVIPFMKPTNKIENVQKVTENSLSDSDFLISIKTEEIAEHENEVSLVDTTHAETSDADSVDDPLFDPDQPDPPLIRSKRKKIANNCGLRKIKQIEKIIDKQQDNTVIDTPKSDTESMKYFLMSLLHEFETMTEEQLRVFKIKVMMLIDDIKTNYHEMKQSLPSSQSDLLQKELINLLLKNLQKGT